MLPFLRYDLTASLLTLASVLSDLASAPALKYLPRHISSSSPTMHTIHYHMRHTTQDQSMLISGITQIEAKVGTGALEQYTKVINAATATPFAGFFAAYNIPLHKCSDQSSFVVGTAVTQRNLVVLSSVIGFFAKMLPIKTVIDETEAFAEYSAKFLDSLIACLMNDEVTYEDIVTQGKASAHSRSYFKCLFAPGGVNMETISQLEMNRLKPKSTVSLPNGEEQYEFLLTVHPKSGQTLLVNSLTPISLIETLGRDPHVKIQDISAVSDTEHERFVKELASTTGVSVVETCLHKLVEEQAKKTPRPTAVEFEDESLTYAELNAKRTCKDREEEYQFPPEMQGFGGDRDNGARRIFETSGSKVTMAPRECLDLRYRVTLTKSVRMDVPSLSSSVLATRRFPNRGPEPTASLPETLKHISSKVATVSPQLPTNELQLILFFSHVVYHRLVFWAPSISSPPVGPAYYDTHLNHMLNAFKSPVAITEEILTSTLVMRSAYRALNHLHNTSCSPAPTQLLQRLLNLLPRSRHERGGGGRQKLSRARGANGENQAEVLHHFVKIILHPVIRTSYGAGFGLPGVLAGGGLTTCLSSLPTDNRRQLCIPQELWILPPSLTLKVLQQVYQTMLKDPRLPDKILDKHECAEVLELHADTISTLQWVVEINSPQGLGHMARGIRAFATKPERFACMRFRHKDNTLPYVPTSLSLDEYQVNVISLSSVPKECANESPMLYDVCGGRTNQVNITKLSCYIFGTCR
ncbi:hypothetical protein BV22DRAFT_1150326 [Leucogyrophana mollusca]|uniref:Uncharacterized protein n=1 Tax=Leucogyrophana mollusca TaxID=85980 RepID=A0ACB8BPR3_9AGAM|nr:hypothetical protein BV22DRAFT_1150326 [Leucogyrophana mollusca]